MLCRMDHAFTMLWIARYQGAVHLRPLRDSAVSCRTIFRRALSQSGDLHCVSIGATSTHGSFLPNGWQNPDSNKLCSIPAPFPHAPLEGIGGGGPPTSMMGQILLGCGGGTADVGGGGTGAYIRRQSHHHPSRRDCWDCPTSPTSPITFFWGGTPAPFGCVFESCILPRFPLAPTWLIVW